MSRSTRDSLFPATSIGRTQGAHIQRTVSTSHEPLSAHPLLSPTPTPTTDVHVASDAPKYVPYTPRQRVSTATASTVVSSGSGAGVSQDSTSATSKLNTINMKAAAQALGVDAASLGYFLLEKLVQGNSEWNDVWTAITSGKATLLLPLEQALPSDKELIIADFVRDHVVLSDGPLKEGTHVVTLSGLRGVFQNDTLTIRGSLHTSSPLYRDILNLATRSKGLNSLPPSPQLPYADTPPSPHIPVPVSPGLGPSPTPTQARFKSTIHESSYPKYRLPTHTSTLPLPPRASASAVGPGKPPVLPARPAPGRLSNPFAALFGGKAAAPVGPSLIAKSPNHSPTPSITSIEHQDHVLEISAYAIDRRIVRRDVARELNKALKTEITTKLARGLAPHWVVDRVLDFVEMLHPLVRESRKGKASATSWQPNAFGVELTDGSGVPVGESAEEVAERLQDLYGGLEQDLRAGTESPKKIRRENSHANVRDRGEQAERSEMKIREIMEAVEATICELFYDKLFMQPSTDDASHDEALSSRVAALNMLDLGLEHLDVMVDDFSHRDGRSAKTELDVVVRACGETLSQLQICQTPADKAAILVAAHRVVVDGLGKLPPIRLKSENDEPTAVALKSEETLVISPQKTTNIPLVSETSPVLAPEDIPIPDTPTFGLPLLTPSDSSTTVIPASPSVPVIQLPEALTPSPSLLTRTRSPSPAGSPRLTLSPPPEETTPVSGDILLPLIIFSVVKANPACLVSHILFIQRFRNQSVGGEESYCLINLMAVAEFLENVDLVALGLGDSDNKVISAANLTPIPINRITPDSSPMIQDGISGSLRGRVEQQVDAITGSANKVITGVVDTSFGVLRSLLPGTPADTRSITSTVQNSAPWNARPGFPFRKDSTFSIASIAASLPGRDRTKSQAGEEGRPMVEVSSRPGSIRSVYGHDSDYETDSSGSGVYESENENEGGEEGEEGAAGDTRSIRSFENMLSKKAPRKGMSGRQSLTNRLATVSGLVRLGNSEQVKASPPSSLRASLGPVATASPRFDTPVCSRPTSPTPSALRLAPPNPRFVDCDAGDLRLSEIGELLREYRRLVEGVRAVGGFEE